MVFGCIERMNIQLKNKIILLCFFCFSVLFAGETAEKFTVFAGIELIELQQNDFQDLGINNYTLQLGVAFPIDKTTSWGLRYSGIGVELSENHLQEPSPAYDGDFTGVTGNLEVQRLYADYYYTWDFHFIRIQPIISAGLGYNSWNFYNSLIEDNYSLQTASIGLSGRFRFTLFSYVFVEIPCIDMFAYLYKSREPEAYLGNAHINFNMIGGMFNWVYAGVSVPLRQSQSSSCSFSILNTTNK